MVYFQFVTECLLIISLQKAGVADLWIHSGGAGDTGLDSVADKFYDVPVVTKEDDRYHRQPKQYQYMLDSHSFRFETKRVEVFKVSF